MNIRKYIPHFNNIEYYFYGLGCIVFIIFAILNALLPSFFHKSSLVAFVGIIIGLLFIIGFLWESGLFILNLLKINLIRSASLIFHAGLILVSHILAKMHIAYDLGLPHQDFDLTAAIISMPIYLLIWILLTSIILFVYFLIYFIFIIFEKAPIKAIGRLMGNILLVFALLSLIEFTYNVINSNTKLIAYYTDYQPMNLYLGNDNAAKVRLHENGIISVACKQKDNTIQITLSDFENRKNITC